MRKIIIDDGTVRANDITLDQIEIVMDTARPDKVEIYMLNKTGERIEGGTFSVNAFMDVILKFYSENF